MILTQSLATLSGVGPRTQELLRQMGLETIQDLLFHLPAKYQNRTRITPIGFLREGDHALIEGEINAVTFTSGKRPSLLCQLTDGSGTICLRFFHFTAAQKQQLIPKLRLRCFGEAKRSYRHYGMEMIHPEYRPIHQAHELPLDQNLTPVYPVTQGLTQPLLRKLTEQALQLSSGFNLEILPQEILSQWQLTDLAAALRYVHRPPPDAPVDLLLQGKHPLQQRLAFEELIAHQIGLQQSRCQARQHPAHALTARQDLTTQFLKSLQFKLTAAQQRVVAEIEADLSKATPMLRLVQGDVGSGKTVVAALTILRAVAHMSRQAVMIAPTELLAEQHYQNFVNWLAPLGIQVEYLSGKQSSAVRTKIMTDMAVGKSQVIIGTHALFQEKVQYHKLGLLVIDEQHRFGVNQRLALRQKGEQQGYFPHQLIMSATPIPRTLAMAAYADLDISVIDELPPGRKPISTVLVSNQRRQEVITRVRHACSENKQVYWVCTLIEDSEVLQCQAAEEAAQELQKSLPEFKIGLVHSRLSSEEKLTHMQAFKENRLHLLVATTVIEVGVDVPNASLMIIENPERLGLSQLHQLRGRVGRGSTASFCVLLFQEPLSALARQRLQVMRSTQDGFVIAKEDLAIRGPGEVLGTRQSGLVKFKVADIMRDQHLLPQVQAACRCLVERYPERATALMARWIRNVEQYVHV